ncbi:MAG: Cytochrome c oxidase polypeptide [Candidatus Sulfotelmatobacter sp.]|nr:Cytochrome c oxidase polypeptide [Candidatus Sulfotelmatobacter sp.]
MATRAISDTPAKWGDMGSINEPIRRPLTLDVSSLPSVAFGHRNTTWLANVFYMAIEGMMFALMFATYFYLRTRSTDWPPGHLPPALTYGVTNALIFVFSLAPAWWVRRRAPEGDRRAVRNGLLVLALFALVATAFRVFEFTTLNCRWSDDAYSSTVWVLIGMHSGHLVTELIETLVLFAISLTPKMEGTRLADAAINSDYWYFVVITGLIVDVLIYGTTRFL